MSGGSGSVAINIADAKGQLADFNAKLTDSKDVKDSKYGSGGKPTGGGGSSAGSGGAGGAASTGAVGVEISETPLADHSQGKVKPIRCEVRQRRILKGHFGRIYAMQWASDSRHLVSASQDGKLIVWNAFTTNKVHAVPLRSSWVMTCAYAPGCNNRLVACGGLDNTATVYRLPEWGSAPAANSGGTNNSGAGKDQYANKLLFGEMTQHEGYVSCTRFLGDDELLTSSGDGTAILWDVDTRTPKRVFSGHAGDVLSLAPYLGVNNPLANSGASASSSGGSAGGGAAAATSNTGAAPGSACFVSTSCDATARLWDMRAAGDSKGGCVHVFAGHEADVNCCAWFPDGNGFATGGDDSSMRLWDIRAFAQLNKYARDAILCAVTSCSFSLTGRVLFGGYDDYNCYAWDSQLATEAGTLAAHENRVSCVSVARDGKALCTGSWDSLLRIWA